MRTEFHHSPNFYNRQNSLSPEPIQQSKLLNKTVT